MANDCRGAHASPTIESSAAFDRRHQLDASTSAVSVGGRRFRVARPLWCSWRCALGTEIFLASITQPHAQLLGHFLALFVRERFVQRDGLVAFASARSVVVRVPERLRGANPTIDLFDEISASERLVSRFLLGWHACIRQRVRRAR